MPREHELILSPRIKQMKSEKKILHKFAAIVIMSMLIFPCSSCTAPDDTETRAIAEPLIEASLELDKILYGEGLNTTDEGKDGKYSRVVDEKFKCVEDIRVACGEIYSAGLCQVVENSVLTGKGTDVGNIYARYIDRGGVLYKYDDYKVNEGLASHYDYSSIKTTDRTSKRIIFTVDRYTSADGEGMEVEITLLWSASLECWQLDSPTY